MSERQVILICKDGPAFDFPELDEKQERDEQNAQFVLDRAGVPRMEDGVTLSLAGRVAWLRRLNEVMLS